MPETVDFAQDRFFCTASPFYWPGLDSPVQTQTMEPTFLFAADAERNGTGRRSLARRCQSGELVRVRPGVYVLSADWRALPRWERDRIRITAAVEQADSSRVLVQQSAAIVWGLPVIGAASDILLLAQGSSHSRRRGELRWVERRLLEPVVFHEGIRLTSRAQTVLDMAAYLPFANAVPAMDQVLRPNPGLGLEACNKDMLRTLAESLPTPAKRVRALRVIDFADKRSESPGESYSRAVLHQNGFPAPELQQEIRSVDGRLLGRTDFYWKEQELVGEFDGAVKYGMAFANGQPPGEALFREKRREDAIRATGKGFVRWTWADVLMAPGNPAGLVQMLVRAGLTRSRRRG